MCLPLKVYKGGKTCVFWDVSDPVSFCRDMKEALVKEGFTGEVSIQAYVDDRDTFSDELQSKYSGAEIQVTLFPEVGIFARISFILVDVILWALSNPVESNLIVFSKNVIGETIYGFQGLYARHHGVLLSETGPGWQDPSESSVSFLTSLFDGGNPSVSDNKKRKRVRKKSRFFGF